MTLDQWVAYLTASLVLIMIPGPDTFLVAGWSAAKGFKSGIQAALGTVSGILVHTCAAAMGLSAILSTSATAFMVIKFIGAAYLVYIGIKTIKDGIASAPDQTLQERKNNPYFQALLTNVLNPKVALFFLAFLPQFIDPSKAAANQLLVLGAAFSALTAVYYLSLVFLAGKIARKIGQNAMIQNLAKWLGGIMMIGFGLRLALASNR
ncbi:LysE family translocator [Endozoicomonas arenosclerae]|uniref:LysE family translocator n=1 Tax=Endozoicomonas arenosclerae TaxID=1633495 RepID=UPI000783B3B9|nr:LysE family translocator [Endozoicomonas arenosclerae]